MAARGHRRAVHGVVRSRARRCAAEALASLRQKTRIARYNPAMRWIVLLREPAERALSHHHMERSRGRERWPLWLALLLERWRLAGHHDELRAAAHSTHVHYLENEQWIFGGVRFLGCALWTNFTIFGFDRRADCMDASERAVNDYALIRVNPKFRRLTPLHTAILHRQSRKWLEERLAEPFPGRTVVVTHHAPSLRSVQSRFRDDPVTAAFAEDMEEFIYSHPIDLWIHGHTHHCVDYTIGTCRVLSTR